MNRSKWIKQVKSSLKPFIRDGWSTQDHARFTRMTKACNICGSEFLQESRFDRFCELCRDGEIYRHSEWATYS